MKKILSILLGLLLVATLVACTDDGVPNEEEPNTFTVTFNTFDGTAISPVTVNEGALASVPLEPTKEGYLFLYWYLTDEAVEFDFDTPITANITLNALWEAEADPIVEPTVQEKIQEDFEAVAAQLYVRDGELSMLTRGPIHNSIITWSSSNKYVSTSGVVLPRVLGDTDLSAMVGARFRLEGVNVDYQLEVDLYDATDVVLEETRVVPFTNLTTEYEVANGELELLFEKDGTVPYVRVQDFFNLLTGFIDPSVEITFEQRELDLFIQYFYYDEEEDYTYDLNVTIDSVTDTLVAPDPGFYWAYVYSTATNFGRHINYDRDNANAFYRSGVDVVYDLAKYNMDVVLYEGDIVLPYYIANQLFAGSSYYNVYYNYDGLYGIYALPSEGDDAYETIRQSSKNATSFGTDLSIHNFNFLAFAMDYFYGLQDLMEVDTYYDVLFQSKDGLLTRSALRFETALSDLLVKSIDEPHTSYGYPGFYNRADYHGPSITSISGFGPRFRSWYMDGLVATDTAIGNKWGAVSGSGWNASNPNRPKFWFLDEAKKSVVLSLDNFRTSDIIENSIWDDETLLSILKVESHVFPTITSGAKYFYYNESSQEQYIAEVLIKGLTASDRNTYNAALLDAGFVLSSTGLSYSKTVEDVTYYVATSFDALYGTMVLSLNAQSAADASEPLFINDSHEMIMSDSAVYMEFQFELILSESPEVSNVILDITWNTGGNVGALYRVVGFITSQPFAVSSINASTKSESTNFVYIDGVPTYDHLNWALLITPTSFSAANSLATIFQDNNLGPIIGIQSGGGASSITPVLLPSGSAFTMSSNNMSAYRTGAGTEEDPFVYTPNELGITPTHPISMQNIYNESVLLGILDEYYPVN